MRIGEVEGQQTSGCIMFSLFDDKDVIASVMANGQTVLASLLCMYSTYCIISAAVAMSKVA